MTNYSEIINMLPAELEAFLHAIYELGRMDGEDEVNNFLWDRQWLEKEIGGEENNMKGCGWVD